VTEDKSPIPHVFDVVIAQDSANGGAVFTEERVDQLLDAVEAQYTAETGYNWTITRELPLVRMTTNYFCDNDHLRDLLDEASTKLTEYGRGKYDYLNDGHDVLVLEAKNAACDARRNGVNGWTNRFRSIPVVINSGGRMIVRVGDSADFAQDPTSVQSLMHEFGHTFGLEHSNAMSCSEWNWDQSKASGCETAEYADRWEFMGNWSVHVSAWHRYQFGLLSASQYALFDQVPTNQTVELVPTPLPTSAGTQVVAITDPADSDKRYVVEYRKDAGGVFVYSYNFKDQTSTLFGPNGRSGPNTALPVGETFISADKLVQIKLTGLTDTKATLVVNGQAGTDPQGNLNNIETRSGGIWVRGWVADNDAPTTPIQVKVSIGGPLGQGETFTLNANLQRTDIPRTYPQFGEYHGFNQTLTTTKRGTQQVYVYAVNAPGTGGADKLIATRTVRIGMDPHGNLNNIEPRPTGIWVRGWAADADAPLAPLQIKVSVGGPIDASGVEVFTFNAKLQRTDIPRTYPEFGEYHGFNLTLEVLTHTGTQPVYVYAINAKDTGGADKLIAIRSVEVPYKSIVVLK
jgi:hypothetical protein